MNQSVSRPIYAVQSSITRSRHEESLLGKIWARLRDSMNSYRVVPGKRIEHQTFLEAGLLDDTVGPEIKRTLRI